MRRFLVRLPVVAGLAVLPMAGLLAVSAPANAATAHNAATARSATTAAPNSVRPPGGGGSGWTYAGWFISTTSCNLHGTVGEWFGEWSTYQCVQVSDNPDDGYYMWIA